MPVQEEKTTMVREFIISYILEHKYPPSVKEIMDGVGFRSTSSAQHHLGRLFETGELETDTEPRQPRALRVPVMMMDRGWIPCSVALPEEKTNPITMDYYEYEVTYRSGDCIDVRHYKYGKGHWWHGCGIMDQYVTAWRERPEPYRG